MQRGRGFTSPLEAPVLNLNYKLLKATSPASRRSWLSPIAPLPSQLLIQQQILIPCISCLSHCFRKVNNKRANRITLVVNEGCSFMLLCELY